MSGGASVAASFSIGVRPRSAIEKGENQRSTRPARERGR